jgi:hypothetical protein
MSLNLLSFLEFPDPPSAIQTLVLSGNYKEYLIWRQTYPNVMGCKYVEVLEDIQDVSGFFVNLVFYGTYQLNPIFCSRQMQRLIAENQSRFRAYIHNSSKNQKIERLTSSNQAVTFPFKFGYA